ncbi:hypothetical protein PSE_3027 [Pseudovibrio sp. FO-BEG1]|nr:hypothetical protein PSE_3027 [Pseudovibrio sp. FO-BEG1]
MFSQQQWHEIKVSTKHGLPILNSDAENAEQPEVDIREPEQEDS